MQIDRKQLIQEERLRNYIRKAIKKINERKTLEESVINEGEDKLRSIIYKLIEVDANTAAPHRSTGINVLEDLLKKIIPQIEIEYKKLTTSPTQRASFRSHIINAIQNSLAPIRIADKAGSEEEAEQAIDIGLEESVETNSGLTLEFDRLNPGDTMVLQRSSGEPDKFFIKRNEDNTFSLMVDFHKDPEASPLHQNITQDKMIEWANSVFRSNDDWRKLFSGKLNEVEDIEMAVGDEEEKFVDIDGEQQSDEKDEKEEDFRIDGKDETGRNIAFRAFERVEQAIVDSYNLLSNDEDRDLFYDYLITNMKLYFDKFEDEILTMIPEPTTPEYEQEKETQLDSEEDLAL